MTGDVTVLGLKSDTCVLADIGMDVPHGRVVTIPADRAVRSKDLYRGINQGYLFRLSIPAAANPALNVLQAEAQSLRERVAQLEAENKTLRERLAQAEARAPLDGKLDAILAALQSGRSLPGALPSLAKEVAEPLVVEVAPPPFIPSKIQRDDMRGHVMTETAEGAGDVSSAAAKLREMRRGQ